jgi:hypothetical protein
LSICIVSPALYSIFVFVHFLIEHAAPSSDCSPSILLL